MAHSQVLSTCVFSLHAEEKFSVEYRFVRKQGKLGLCNVTQYSVENCRNVVYP